MKDVFPEFYREEDFYTRLWHTGIFVPDACTLLRMYQYAPESSKHLFNILLKLGDSGRLWIPYQFAREYHKNLESVIGEIESMYSGAKSELQTSLTFSKSLNKVKNLVVLSGFKVDEADSGRLEELLETEAKKVLNSIDKDLSQFEAEHTARLQDDSLRYKIAKLFEPNLGKRPSRTELEQMYKRAEAKLEWNHPLLSAKNMEKRKPEGFGDFVGWEQIKDWARDPDVTVPVVLVSDDSDWFDDQAEPHPYLIREMHEECGISFFAYKTKDFRKWAEKHLNIPASETVEQEDEVREQYMARQVDIETRRRNRASSRGFGSTPSKYRIAEEMLAHGADKEFIFNWIDRLGYSFGFDMDFDDSILAAQMNAQGASTDFIVHWLHQLIPRLGMMLEPSDSILAAQMNSMGASTDFIVEWLHRMKGSWGMMLEPADSMLAAQMNTQGATTDFIVDWLQHVRRSVGLMIEPYDSILAAQMNALGASFDFTVEWLNLIRGSSGMMLDRADSSLAAQMNSHGADIEFISEWLSNHRSILGMTLNHHDHILAAQMSAHGLTLGTIIESFQNHRNG